MNKVIIINLNGNAYQLEEDGYEALRRYLDEAARRLQGNPDREEILADIEQSIADKFRAVLGPNKSVVVAREVQAAIDAMGPVQGDDGPAGDPGPRAAASAGSAGRAENDPRPTPQRLYRIMDGAMVGGVCNGIAAYLAIDVTIIRIIFAALTLTFGAGVILYFAMMFIIPVATTPAEMDAAFGAPSTAEEFVKRAREGYYAGMKAFRDRGGFRSWKRQFKRDIKEARRNFRREMGRNLGEWHRHWNPGPRPVAHAGWFLEPILSIVAVAVTILAVSAIASLVLTGAVFGAAVPHGLPLWASILIILVAARLASWPVYAVRHSYSRAWTGPWIVGPVHYVGESIAWLVILAFFLWFADGHFPSVHAALDELRREAHRALDSVRAWWASR